MLTEYKHTCLWLYLYEKMANSLGYVKTDVSREALGIRRDKTVTEAVDRFRCQSQDHLNRELM